MAEMAFYTEDVCRLKGDTNSLALGVIERTSTDVDTHTPFPAKKYNQKIDRHEDTPISDFDKFLLTGIPLEGTVLVAWMHRPAVQLIPTSHLELVDRSLIVGDIVKRRTEEALSGTIIGTEVKCTVSPMVVSPTLVSPEDLNFRLPQNPHLLLPIAILESRTMSPPIEGLQALSRPDGSLQQIPSEELRRPREYQEEDLVIYHDWVGIIEEVFEAITIQLVNNNIVEVQDPDALRGLTPRDDLELTDKVTTTKGNLRRGRWIFGEYDANVEPDGSIVDIRPRTITVRWLCRRIGAPADGSWGTEEPPEDLGTDVLNSGEVHVYDQSRVPLHASPEAVDSRRADFILGEVVRFKDLNGAAMKYDGNHEVQLKDGTIHKNHLHKISRTASLGFDMNVFEVRSTETMVRVQWQDLSITTCPSTDVIPDINIDENTVWPGEIVTSKERKASLQENWLFEPTKVGVVQRVNAADRIACVRWFTDASVKYHSVEDMDANEYFSSGGLLPGSTSGKRTDNDKYEEVSLYDIRAASGLNKRRGDLVILHPPPDSSDLNKGMAIDWFGEVVDLGLDGLLTVRLGALDKVRDVRVGPEHVTLVFNNEMIYDAFDDNDGYDSDDESSLGVRLADDIAEEVREQWLEYVDADGNLQRVEDETGELELDEAWLTEEDVSDDEMPNLIDPALGIHSDDGQWRSEDKTPPSEISVTNEQPPPPEEAMEIDLEPAEEQPSLGITDSSDAPAHFAILDTPVPADHAFSHSESSLTPHGLKRIQKEHRILHSSLPEGIFVRAWESRLDLFRILIIGPLDTPYEFAPFLIDMRLPSDYPQAPPEAYFHSWTSSHGPVNPNLYENGKICLSLLGTWHADERNENWSPSRSTVLQVLVSILGLVLVKEPYYNEAGFEVRAGSADSQVPSRLYSERTYFVSRGFISFALTNPPKGFEDVVHWLYKAEGEKAPRLLERAIEAANALVQNGEGDGANKKLVSAGGLSEISKGALVMLKRQLAAMEKLRFNW